MQTICAIATPSGGALGIVRVSGEEAVRITSSLFRPAGQTQLDDKAGGSLSFGHIVDPETGEIVDEVLVSLFRAPHSYTGEDATEISCHGSAYILSRVMQLLLAAGCRTAAPGEFTQRAFLNGKMDLSQAEAVADLIASTTAANHRMAMQQMRGGFSRELRKLRDELLHITSLLELELDFSDHEELEFASRDELKNLAEKIRGHVASLCGSFRLGNALKRGIPIAIVGETNAGKSTLLNALVGEERALVSNIHGTTRDTIEETVVIGDTLVRFIDTAGIRQTDDEVERMGIERTYAKLDEAEIVLWLLDATKVHDHFPALAPRLLPACRDKQLVIILNKQDLLPPAALSAAERFVRDGLVEQFGANEKHAIQCLSLCAQSPETLMQLTPILTRVLQSLQASTTSSTDTIVSNTRHYEALTAALSALDRVRDGLQADLSGDLVGQDLRECLHHLGEIIGEISTDTLLQNIFRHFCIGK